VIELLPDHAEAVCVIFLYLPRPSDFLSLAIRWHCIIIDSGGFALMLLCALAFALAVLRVECPLQVLVVIPDHARHGFGLLG
jgi:hypothetical protein